MRLRARHIVGRNSQTVKDKITRRESDQNLQQFLMNITIDKGDNHNTKVLVVEEKEEDASGAIGAWFSC